MRTLSWTEIGSNLGTPVISGNTYGAANEYEPPMPGCVPDVGSLGGPDLSYKWTAPVPGHYTFTTAGSTFDTVLHIYNFTVEPPAPIDLLGCNDDVNGHSLTSSVILNLNAGQEVRLVVDTIGLFSKYKNFSLHISYTCGSPPSPCHQSPGTWNGSTCFYPPKSAGTACDDGIACTSGDVCNGSGSCSGSPLACNSPPSQCHQPTGTCSNGICSYVLKGAGASCDDGNACSTGDVCNSSGSCSGSPLACISPPSQCHQPAGTCSNGNCSYAMKGVGASCDDGNACTTGDVCDSSGSCSGSPLACNNPPNQCYQSAGTCFGGSCAYAPKTGGSSCDDGISCTVGDVCNGSGSCSGSPLVCSSPPSQCHQSSGICSNGTCTYALKGAGAPCNDGNACTTTDLCDNGGTCGGTPLACNSPPSQCHQPTGACSNGTCAYALKGAGAPCNDGNACTTADLCDSGGTCGGTPLACSSPPSQCHQPTGTCSNGTCSYALKAAGATCNDGNACTTMDLCDSGGTCSGTPLSCNSPPSQCHQPTGTCSNGTCSYALKAAGASCEDGNACTTGDVCNGSGSCSGIPRVCNTPPGSCYWSIGTCSNGICTYEPILEGVRCTPTSCWGVCDGNGYCDPTAYGCH